MFKLLSLFAVVATISAASLEWPANLVALSSSKSSSALPLPVNDSESAELASEGNASATAASASASASADEPELEQILSESASGSSSADEGDARLLSTVPVSVPLPLILASRPGLRSVLTIREPTLAKLGELVEHVPTAVSHQSQTVVHDHRRLVTPIVGPAVRTTQVVRQHPPLVWTLAAADPRVVLLRN